MCNGIVFNIQKFCVNDGPGIRTTVFLKGCPLRCEWCHNPESHKAVPELMYSADKCAMCGKCAEVCQNNVHVFENGTHTVDRDKCKACGTCADICPADAIEIAGNEMSADEVIKEVMKDKAFYDNSGGGMTVSGGEPFAQFDFLYELLKAAKQNGLHTCIETCGFAPKDKILAVAEFIDIFLFDWKLTGDILHQKYTNVSNRIIKENLTALDERGSKIILRCPIIPGINDTDEHFNGIASLAESLKNVLGIEIEPYHPLGKDKYARLGKSGNTLDSKIPDDETVKDWISRISKMTEIPVKKA